MRRGKNRGQTSKTDIQVGVCYRPANQEEEVDVLLYKQLQDVSRLSALVFVDEFIEIRIEVVKGRGKT